MDWKKLLGSITESVDEELRLRNAYLIAENRILRQQISGRVQLTDSDRQALAEIGMQLGKKALAEIATVAQPDTILAWHRKFASPQGDISQLPKSVGRPRIAQEMEDLVVRMARENRSWGYDRIVGALKHLGYTISDQTVGNILKRRGVPSAPARKKTMTWEEFIRIHMAVLMATDFFLSEVWNWFRMLISFLLSFIHCGHRQAQSAGVTRHHPGRWTLSRLLRSLDLPADRARGVDAINKGVLSRRILCGEGVRRLLLSQFHPADCGEHRSRGLAKVVSMSAVHPRPIRDGPLHRRHRLGRFPTSHDRKAA